MSTTNATNLADLPKRSLLKAQILACQSANKLLIKCVGKLTTDGDPDLLGAVADLHARSAQDVNSLYTSMYQLGFQHGKLFGPMGVQGLPSLPETAGGRVSLLGYCRGMIEALEMAQSDAEQQLGTQNSVPEYDSFDREDLLPQQEPSARKTEDDPKS